MKTLYLNPVLKDGVLLGEAFNLGGINYQFICNNLIIVYQTFQSLAQIAPTS